MEYGARLRNLLNSGFRKKSFSMNDFLQNPHFSKALADVKTVLYIHTVMVNSFLLLILEHLPRLYLRAKTNENPEVCPLTFDIETRQNYCLFTYNIYIFV